MKRPLARPLPMTCALPKCRAMRDQAGCGWTPLIRPNPCRRAQRRQCLGIQDQPHAKAARRGKNGPLTQADIQRPDLGIGGAGIDDACHEPFLRFKISVAREPIDLFDQRVIVEDMGHAILRNQDEVWRNGQGQVKQMRFWHNVVGPIGPDVRGNI